MADAAQLRKLVAYNQWANEKILKSIDGMTAEELARPVDAYFGSIEKNLQHVLGAMRVWLARWNGEVPPSLQAPIGGPWPDEFGATHVAYRAFVESLTGASAGRIVDYKDTKGNPYRNPLDQLISHVVNHGTHHRAETGMVLERIGRSPGDMDYILYCRTVDRA